jgi:host factor-I protein
MKTGLSQQESFLDTLISEQAEVSVFLVNGIRLAGTIHSYDQNVVVVGSDTGLMTVFKHSVSTIQIGPHKRELKARVHTGMDRKTQSLYGRHKADT